MENNRPTKKVTVINRYSSPAGGAYFLGFLGAFIYYIQQAATFSEGLIGFFKAIVWPAILVYHLFSDLHL